MQPYASSSDLQAWISPADLPGNADRLLRSATIRVARATNRSPYDTPTGDDAQPLADAVCAQAASWISLGIDPDAQGLDSAPVKQSKILTGDVTYDTAGQAQARQGAADELCQEAADILQATGLLWEPVPVGSEGCLPDWGFAHSPGPVLARPDIDWP